jgi:hypothetical protein
MKLEITGASNFVNRMFEACGNYQWAREFLKNSLEAQATKIEFGIEWQAVEKLGTYRRTIIDDGSGMDREELLRFFSTLGEGAKKIAGIHDNFGVGAKIASLPWNPEGVVIISYKNGRGSMIWIMLNDSGDYELVDFVIDGTKTCVIEPAIVDDDGIDWAALRPDWLDDHGTIVVLLGSEGHPDTVLGNPQMGEREIKGLSVYLNSRFWDLTSAEVKVVELRSLKKNHWPQGPNDKDNSRRPNNRLILGARHYLTEVKAQTGKLRDSGVLLLDEDRVEAEWYLWGGDRPHIDSYARMNGYVAVRYNDELFQITSNKVHFRWFGVIEGKVQQNLSIILSPQHYQTGNGRWGIHPDQSRNHLLFTGNGDKGVEMPLSDWGLEFAETMPEPIRGAIREARGDLQGSIDDDDYRKRLQDKFGNRWMTKALVRATRESRNRQDVAASRDEVEASRGADANGDAESSVISDLAPDDSYRRRKRSKTVKVVRRAVVGLGEAGVEREVPVDIPRFRAAKSDAFTQPWHIALWAPNDTDGPTVLINIDSPILQEVVEYHQAQYPDVYAEEVAKTVRQVFGEVAACKVAHSQKLTKNISEEELDRVYRNEQALTLALMGLMAEESVIAQRLGKLGRKKTVQAINTEAAA